MNDTYKKSLQTSTIFHLALIGLICLFSIPFIRNLFFPPKDPPTPCFVMAIPEPDNLPASVSAPTPPVAMPPDSPSERAVPIEPLKQPSKPMEKPKVKPAQKIEKSTNRIVRLPLQPPIMPQGPELTEDEIRRRLTEGENTGEPSTVTTDVVSFDLYYAMVKQAMYDVWRPPGGVSLPQGIVAVASIRVQRDGTIVQRSMLQPSGNPGMDDSVMKAVQSVSKLAALPSQFLGSEKTITIEFEPTGLSF